jgi:hypothetical protein
MICIPTTSIASNFGIDISTSSLGMLQLLQDNDSCPFGDHEAAPVFIKRA